MYFHSNLPLQGHHASLEVIAYTLTLLSGLEAGVARAAWVWEFLAEVKL